MPCKNKFNMGKEPTRNHTYKYTHVDARDNFIYIKRQYPQHFLNL